MFKYRSLEKYNTYRIQSFAKYIYFPANNNDIINIINKHKKLSFIGNGSNIIFSKKYYNNVAFIIFTKKFNSFKIINNYVNVQAGVLLKDLVFATYNKSLSGIEVFYDIPGSVGGALIMNASAYGEDIYNYVKSVTILDINTKNVKKYLKKDIKYGYRCSIFKKMKNICILSAEFKFKYKSKQLIKHKINTVYSYRLSSLPQKPTAGSVFKRSAINIPVAIMIDKLNLKGKKIGDAEISIKHGGIIVNNGNATGQNILDLIKYIKKQIFKNYNIMLNEEQIII